MAGSFHSHLPTSPPLAFSDSMPKRFFARRTARSLYPAWRRVRVMRSASTGPPASLLHQQPVKVAYHFAVIIGRVHYVISRQAHNARLPDYPPVVRLRPRFQGEGQAVIRWPYIGFYAGGRLRSGLVLILGNEPRDTGAAGGGKPRSAAWPNAPFGRRTVRMRHDYKADVFRLQVPATAREGRELRRCRWLPVWPRYALTGSTISRRQSGKRARARSMVSRLWRLIACGCSFPDSLGL